MINRREGDHFLLRIDDTDPARNVSGAREATPADLDWLGLAWDEGPVRQSQRQGLYRAAGEPLGSDRFGRTTILREDGTATYHLASVVDDAELGITHVYRGNDHRPNEDLHRRLHEALDDLAGVRPPRPDPRRGREEARSGPRARRSRRCASSASRPRPCVATSKELPGCRDTTSTTTSRASADSVDAIEAMGDEELAARAEIPYAAVPVARGARDLSEARDYAAQVLEAPEPRATAAPETLERFRELAEAEPRAVVRELKAVGGDLRALRVALTGRDRGPELAAILAALPREEALRRVDQAPQHTHS